MPIRIIKLRRRAIVFDLIFSFHKTMAINTIEKPTNINLGVLNTNCTINEGATVDSSKEALNIETA